MKNILCFLFSFSLCSYGFSQFTFGPVGGVNFSKLLDSSDTHLFRIGPYFGGYGAFALNDYVSLRGELGFATKGEKYKMSSSIDSPTLGTILTTISGKTYLNYLDIPLLIQVGALQTYVQTGVVYSVLLTVKNEATVTSTILGTSTSTSTDKSGIKSTDIGIPLRAFYETESGLQMGGGGIISFHNINAKGSSIVENFVMCILVGYKFGDTGGNTHHSGGGGGHHRRRR